MRGVKPRLVIDDSAILEAPSPPDWLSPEARQEWERVVPLLVDRGFLTVVELGSLENYCVAIGVVRAMEVRLQRDGHVIEVDGKLKRHPGIGIQADAMTRARLLATELGLTPVSRARSLGGGQMPGAMPGAQLDFLG